MGKGAQYNYMVKHWFFSHPFAISGTGKFEMAAQLISHCLWLSDPGSE